MEKFFLFLDERQPINKATNIHDNITGETLEKQLLKQVQAKEMKIFYH
jgi:hypothetical protein